MMGTPENADPRTLWQANVLEVAEKGGPHHSAAQAAT